MKRSVDVGSATAVIIFTREPVPGKTKSRLAATVGPEMAAEVHRLLLDHTLGQARRSGLMTFVSLANEPAAWRPPEGMGWLLQRGPDLGTRLHQAFQRVLGLGFAKVLIIGSDCPEIGAHHLAEAVRALDQTPVVLGPASDGGYWLIGQRQAGWDLFSTVPWSSPETLNLTRQRIRSLDLEWYELEVLSDIDTIDDLKELLERESLERGLADGLARLSTHPTRKASIS